MTVRRARIAGILDCHGGLRVVVSDDVRSIYANCDIMHPERLFLMPPSCWVELDDAGNIPWGMIPWTIRRVELYIAEWCATRNDPDNLKHIAIQRYLSRCELNSQDGFQLRGLLPPPEAHQ